MPGARRRAALRLRRSAPVFPNHLHLLSRPQARPRAPPAPPAFPAMPSRTIGSLREAVFCFLRHGCDLRAGRGKNGLESGCAMECERRKKRKFANLTPGEEARDG